LRQMGRAGADRAKKYTWEDYGERFLNWLQPLLKHE
jgi:hypothetical protein